MIEEQIRTGAGKIISVRIPPGISVFKPEVKDKRLSRGVPDAGHPMSNQILTGKNLGEGKSQAVRFGRVVIAPRMAGALSGLFRGVADNTVFPGLVSIRPGDPAAGPCLRQRQEAVVIHGVIRESHAALPRIASALDSPRHFLCMVQGGKQQSCQNRDDRDHHQEFNQREFPS